MPTWRTGSACAAEKENAAAPAIEASSRRVMANRSLTREAIEQPVAARALQVVLAAAAVRTTRGMGGIPRQHRRRIVEALTIMMTDHRGARGALAPVAAGALVRAGEGGTIGLRAGQDVVTIRRVAASVDHIALLIQRSLLVEIVRRTVQVGDVLGDHRALGVLPWAAADAVLGINGTGTLRREISLPRLAGRAGSGRARGAMRAGAF